MNPFLEERRSRERKVRTDERQRCWKERFAVGKLGVERRCDVPRQLEMLLLIFPYGDMRRSFQIPPIGARALMSTQGFHQVRV